VRTGGLIIMDNVLWHGKVADPSVSIDAAVWYLNISISALIVDCLVNLQVNDPKTVSIRNFNRKLLEDKRISISMVG
jgi:predicted O-methyltransferase YrrM